jgi:cytochrome c biogenesis protein CcmG/thiol:disulfide interchange protein DsbE
MGGKIAVATGLLAGAVVGGALVGGLVLMAPAPPAPVLATPSPSAALASVAPSSSSSPAPSSTAAAPSSASAAPSSASPSSSAGAGGLGFFIGQRPPALAVKALDGSTLDLASFKGRPLWVNFMATWCPSCVDELPLMTGFEARYAASGLAVVLVDVREDAPTVKAFLASLKVPLPAGLDTTGAAAQAWRATALPMHFWIDSSGIVRYGAVGSVGPDLMAKGLGAILPGVTATASRAPWRRCARGRAASPGTCPARLS